MFYDQCFMFKISSIAFVCLQQKQYKETQGYIV